MTTLSAAIGAILRTLPRIPGRIVVWVAVASLALTVVDGSAQDARIRDLTVTAGDVPVRMMGYGLVVGLDGTGDRVIGGFSSGHTVRSVANLLRRFGVEVPESMLRTRNVAAVLVTAEASPYLRPGGRFDLHVASIGDAVSLKGGVLWMTPLSFDMAAPPVASAQGALMVSEAMPMGRGEGYAVETTAVLPAGGLMEQAMPLPSVSGEPVLYLKNPDVTTATRIANAINTALGEGRASVLDPGAVGLQFPADSAQGPAEIMAQINDLRVSPDRAARVIIDGRSGTVVAGGGIVVGEAVVSHGSMTLSIGGSAMTPEGIPGDLRLEPGVSVQAIAAALHGVAAPPQAIASVFESLRQVGALSAEVHIR